MEDVEQLSHHIPTSDDLKIVSRLILNRILSCDAVQYLRHKSIERVRAMMLSPEPDKDVTLSFTDDEDEKKSTNQRYYGTGVCEMTIQWSPDQNEIIDGEGNVWQSYRLNMGCSIISAYSLSDLQLSRKSDVVSSVSRLASELREMVPDALRIRALSDSQRRERDEIRRIESVVEKCMKLFSREHRLLRSGLRVNGKPRSFRRDQILPGVLPGTYKFEVNDGSRWSTKGVKKYSVFIPENLDYLCTIKRIA